ncbi:MAG: HEAT repeat domain-containing protein [Phycisphaerales bacterium]|nr:HEAT repeat domain-containing protein [Phycisphaerales bacterium]
MAYQSSSQQCAAARVGFTRGHKIIVALMLAATLVALANRDSLRAWRWRHGLIQADSEAERRRCALHLAALGSAGLPSLEALLVEGGDPVKVEVIAALGKVANPRAVDALVRAAGDTNPALRACAVRAMGEQPAALAADALTTILQSGDERLGRIAVSAMARLNTDSMWQRLGEALRTHPSPGVRVQIIEEIAASRRVECVPSLVEALADAAVFHGQTLMEEHQAAIFPQLVPRIESELHGASGWSLELPARHVVGEDAAAALRAITGRDFEYRFDDEESVQAAIESWRSWLAGTEPP